MTAPQAVFIASTSATSLAGALVTAGVAMLAGAAWALIAAGCLLGLGAVGMAVVLLHDGGPGA